MGKYFGTDGFRGEANIGLTADHAYKIGRFLGWYYGREGKKARTVIGKDTRRSSYMFEYSLVGGIVASGADAYLMHVTTTPSVAYIARVDEFDCGIMISASHNPFYDNGIKLINGKGEKMDEETILKVEDYIDGKIEVPMAVRDQIGCTVDYSAGRNRYIGYLISLATRSYKNIKVGLDCANGSSWMIAKSVFDALGAKTYVINNDPDGTNINTNCGSTHIEVLQEFVKEKQLDVGFAYDGDADRCICVDENGDVVYFRQLFHAFLRKRFSARRHIYEMRFFTDLAAHLHKRVVNGLRHHKHSFATAVRRVVNLIVLIDGKFAYLMKIDFHNILFSRPAYHAFAHNGVAHFGEKR